MNKLLKMLRAPAAALILALAVGASPALADTSGAATVTASALNMRSEATTGSAVVTCLPRGTVVLVNGVSGNWYQVTYKGQSGYMSADYLSVSDSADAAFGDGVLTGSDVRVRSGPGTSYDVLGYVNTGDTYAVTGVSDNWCKISYNGQTGYVSSTYIRFSSGGGTTSDTGAASGSDVSGAGTINATDVRFRTGPGTTYSILGVFSKGDSVTVSARDGDWYKVSFGGKDGYVYKPYVTMGSGGSGSSSGTGSSGQDIISVTAMADTEARVISPVHMRSGPATSYSSQRVLDTGAIVTITGSSDKWYRVSYNGSEGYVFKTYLTTDTSAPAPSASSSSEGQRLVDEAKRYLGVPYVYGGTSPSGFDCSGFVYYVYKQCGYSITRTATAQNSVGSYVSRGELRPGDIIIFYNSAKSAIGHAGLYIGDGQFIHASSGSGKVVITSLSASYYDTHYYSARRVVG